MLLHDANKARNSRRGLLNLFQRSWVMLFLLVLGTGSFGQSLVIMDRDRNDHVVNDSVVHIFSTDSTALILTANFLIRNDSPDTLNLYLKRSIEQMGDSTMDFYCFYTQCWFYADSTDIPNPIPPGGLDYTFIPHVCHLRMFDGMPLEPGTSIITYTLYDPSSQPQPFEAKVTVKFQLTASGRARTLAKEIRAFPNPTNDFLIIENPYLSHHKWDILVLNSLGKHLTVPIERQSGRIKLDTSSLPAGLYVGTLRSGDGVLHPFRFLKVR